MTAAAMSPDGMTLAVRTYYEVYFFERWSTTAARFAGATCSDRARSATPSHRAKGSIISMPTPCS